ncbi:thioesterase domain-containing protein [Novosphingobium sp.]|uniref:thioesterase domain-containing protein n=1 Tax=Novosphingobium sp. TaxID=1874826 RepID=UPI0038BBEED1
MSTVSGDTTQDIAETITRIWQDVLGVPPTDPRQDFFAAGGDSLGFVGLIEGIEAELGVLLPTDMLVLDSMGDGISPTALLTAAQTVECGDGASSAAHDRGLSLVPLYPAEQLGERRPMLHIFPGLGAHAVSLQELGLALGDDVRLCVFHRELDDPLGGTLEELAARAVRLLRRAQPRGPYHVGGYSFGAFVAYEMVRQLTAAGETVAPLVIIDGPCPLWHLTPANALPVAWRIVRSALDLRRPIPRLSRVISVLRARDLADLPRQALVAEHDRIARDYRRRVGALSRPSVQILLYCGDEQPRGRLNAGPAMGWDLLRGATVRRLVLPGRHGAILQGSSVVALAMDLVEALAAFPPEPLRPIR